MTHPRAQSDGCALHERYEQHDHSLPAGRRIADLARSGFRPSLAVGREVARHRDRSRDELFGWLRGPLGDGLDGTDAKVQLAELTIHGEDIRRPLGIEYALDAAVVHLLLDHGLTRVGNIAVAGARRRARGLHLAAPDVGWSSGEGPTVTGPGASLLLALNGRRGALADLSGPGVTVLESRMAAAR